MAANATRQIRRRGDSPTRFTSERIAALLVPRRDLLVERLPLELAAARGLTRDQSELIVDEAIEYVVTGAGRPLSSTEMVEQTFWAAAALRAKRVHEGRHETVRAGWRRVDIDDLPIASNDEDPADTAVRRYEETTLLEFAATLSESERDVLAVKYGSGARIAGRNTIARHLGMEIAEVRKAERSIERQLARFVAIVAAGTICSHHEASLVALATGDALNERVEHAARLHLQACPSCRAEYATHMRAVRSGRLPRKLAELLPFPPAIDGSHRPRAVLDTLTDLLARPFGHESTISGLQAASAARGLGTLATAKLALLCVSSVTLVGGAVYCFAPSQYQHPHKPSGPSTHKRVRTAPTPDRPRLAKTNVPIAVPTATATPKPKRAAKVQRSSLGSGGTGPSAHERSGAVSRAPAGSAAQGGSEFGPSSSGSTASAPAAAAGGGSEFP